MGVALLLFGGLVKEYEQAVVLKNELLERVAAQ
jgi:hypothetical protein